MVTGYYFDDDLDLKALLAPAAQLEDRLARLDERLRRWPLAEGVVRRGLFREAIGWMWLEGERVHLRDLVLLEEGALNRAPEWQLSAAFAILQHWRAAAAGPAASLLLMAEPRDNSRPPEQPLEWANHVRDPDRDEVGRMREWRAALRETEPLPPALAAAVAMDAWLMLQPIQHGEWRAPLIGALLLRKREKSWEYLLPISWGAQTHDFRWKPQPALTSRASLNARLRGLMGWMEAAVTHMDEEANRLSLAHQVVSLQLEGRRRNSKLPALATLLFTKGPVSIPTAAEDLGITYEAARKMFTQKQLGSQVQELTRRGTYRVYDIGGA